MKGRLSSIDSNNDVLSSLQLYRRYLVDITRRRFSGAGIANRAYAGKLNDGPGFFPDILQISGRAHHRSAAFAAGQFLAV
jgi:hypothetical protein